MAVVTGWSFASAVGLVTVYSTYDAMIGGHVISLTETVLYNGLQRTAWSVVVSYLIIACALGYGGKKGSEL